MLLPVGGVLEACRRVTCVVILGTVASFTPPTAVAAADSDNPVDPVEIQSDRFRVAVTPARGGSILAMAVKKNGTNGKNGKIRKLWGFQFLDQGFHGFLWALDSDNAGELSSESRHTAIEPIAPMVSNEVCHETNKPRSVGAE
jgi:hypothetical protein